MVEVIADLIWLIPLGPLKEISLEYGFEGTLIIVNFDVKYKYLLIR